jgi:hypothetical protein
MNWSNPAQLGPPVGRRARGPVSAPKPTAPTHGDGQFNRSSTRKSYSSYIERTIKPAPGEIVWRLRSNFGGSRDGKQSADICEV